VSLAVPFVGVGLLLAATTGCGGSATGANGKRTVVAAFYPLAWAAEQIGGRRIHVVDLTPPGAEPHDIELTPRDVGEIRDAALVLYLGRGFQPAVEKAVQSRTGPSIDLLRGQTLRAGTESGEGAQVDPHVWLDPARFAGMVATIGRKLGHARVAARLEARLHALDAEMARGLRTCRWRQIVTSHAAFGYLAARYHLRQVPLAGLSPEAEPSPRDLEALVREVEQTGSTTVFFETLVSPRLAQTVAREAGAKTAVLDPLEGLTKDEADAGDDYFSVMRSNLRTLREALGCR